MIAVARDESWMEVLERNAVWIVVLLAIAASIAGLRNGFALDDIEVIIKNPRLHSLRAPWGLLEMTYWRAEMGATLYRPMTMLVFALQWVAGNGSPLPFHVVSIAVYAALSAAVYKLARLIVPFGAAIVGATIFAVHPVHVEAVANIVGQSELWVALLVVVLVTRYVAARRRGAVGLPEVARLSAGYLVACGFKEHAIVLPLLLIAADFLLIGDNRTASERVRGLGPVLLGLAAAALVFLLARFGVLHGSMLDSKALIFREQTFATRFFTMLSVIVEWIRLFAWPMSLSADYSFPRIRTHTGFEAEMLPAVAVLAGAAWIAWYVRKRSPVAAFGIAWMGVAMLIPSNLVVVTGFVLAERTLMLATVGFALCAGVISEAMFREASARGRATATACITFLCVLLLTFVGRSMTRSTVWQSNRALIEQTVLDVPSSHRAHWMRAVYLGENNRWPAALDEMDLAVALGEPNDVLLLASGGDMFAMNGRCPRALPLYRRALALGPKNVQLRANTARCLLNIGKLEEAKTLALNAGADAGDERLQRLASASDSLELARSRARVFP